MSGSGARVLRVPVLDAGNSRNSRSHPVQLSAARHCAEQLESCFLSRSRVAEKLAGPIGIRFARCYRRRRARRELLLYVAGFMLRIRYLSDSLQPPVVVVRAAA